MKWVTRARPKVDRVACPWLIKRFIDPDAQILYVPADSVLDTAKRENAVPFDVPNVELGHHGPECSFDAIVKKYNLQDPALQDLALIVRGADTAAKDLTPESQGLEAIAEGFRLIYQNDHELLEREMAVYDALYAYCREMWRRAKQE
ncbi:MAG: chromate resistance protein ChrB domain-containing protein [Candidatus Binatia bacterium]